MNQRRFWGFCILALYLTMPALLFSQSRNQLKLGLGQAKIGGVASIPLTLSTTDQVQGLVATYEWDGTTGTGDGLVPGPAIATANTDRKSTRLNSSHLVISYA